ncbi:hypothetical protein SADUNF_Sadunf17G0121700 [Salix dunnii]|uniref:Pentatricopeptide repeat-containing protein n=1 Tax=Salix dunnii TaxID=1413687 RepID=A0A835J7A6_9ROSI|nr:hypothetical protein SADUNF_Sadunf17G0121700 [Salix dunnii]
MGTFKLPKTHFSPPQKTLCAFSTWYSPPPETQTRHWPPPPPPPPHHESPILTTISEAIKNIETKQLHISLKKILPSFKAHHFISLVNQNPYFLPPNSLFSFFNFLSLYPTFSHTVQSYCSMVHFLIAHRMNQQAESLLHFVVSRKGKGSASSVFASILETKGTVLSSFVFDALMSVYTECGYLADAIQGLVPNGVTFTTLINGQCKNGRVDLALDIYQQMVTKALKADLVLYNTLVNGFCKGGYFREARKLVGEMTKRGLRPDKFTYTTLLDGQMKNADMLLNAMLNLGVVPDDITYNILLEGHCRHGKLGDFHNVKTEMGLVSDYASYISLLNEIRSKASSSEKRTPQHHHEMLAELANK